MKGNRTKGIAGQVGIALLIFLGLSIRLPGGGRPGLGNAVSNLLTSFEGFDLSRLWILFGVFFLVNRGQAGRDSWKRGTVLVPAVFFALCVVLGSSFDSVSSWSQAFSLADGQLVKSLLAFGAYTALFDAAIRFLYGLLDRAADARPRMPSGPRRGILGFFRRCLEEHPFLTAFLLLLLAYLPHILVSYPGVFMGDTWQQVVQAYPELQNTGSPYLSADRVLQAGVYLNQNHPVVHTLLIHLFLVLGDGLFRSLNVGIFLYDFCQLLFLLCAFARVLSLLSKDRDVSPVFMAGYLLYVFFNPLIHNYLFLITKDTCYSACLLFLLCGLYRFLRGDRGRGAAAEVLLSALGMLLFRNEARFLLPLVFLLLALLLPGLRKRALGLAAILAAFSLGVFYLLFPALGFTPGSRREPLSVPMQQVARCVRDNREDISGEEWQAIDRVLEADKLADLYDPTLADPVKGTFREEATSEDLAGFMKTWLTLFFRHPDTCLQATLNHYYQYFYPGKTRMYRYPYSYSELNLNFTNRHLEPLGKSFSLPAWSANLRKNIDILYDGGLMEFPPSSFLMSAPVYFWGMILLLCWVVRRRSRSAAALLVCPLLVLLLLLFGPTGGDYGRYLLPVVCALPALGAMCMMLVRRDGKKGSSGGALQA